MGICISGAARHNPQPGPASRGQARAPGGAPEFSLVRIRQSQAGCQAESRRGACGAADEHGADPVRGLVSTAANAGPVDSAEKRKKDQIDSTGSTQTYPIERTCLDRHPTLLYPVTFPLPVSTSINISPNPKTLPKFPTAREGVRSAQAREITPSVPEVAWVCPARLPGVRLSLDSRPRSARYSPRPTMRQTASPGTPRSGRRAHPRRPRGPEAANSAAPHRALHGAEDAQDR